ncbi:putative transporter SVOPL [Venturia canescens]|uniref:putative transporter SVOPL n=1 Tax=Venturia canescens TaxID=32260 RepID=UPI001C9D3FA2|nr:putative transporter SVOPL [Venturia canescens]
MNDCCESALNRTGWGLCHYFLVGICGLCSLAEASASLVVLVVTPLLACDLHFEKSDVMTLNAILSLGMAFGGMFFGTLADHHGRKSLIPGTLVIIFCSSIYLSFSQRFFPINFAIFWLGAGAAGNNVIIRVYLIECLPAKRRGSCLALVDLLWVLGFLASFAMTWSLVPSVVRLLNKEFRPSSWRVLVGLGAAPSLIIACAAALLPLSPRYLLYRRHPQHAFNVLQQIYAVNNSRHADHFPPCRLEGCVQPNESNDTGPDNLFKSLRKYGTKTWKRIERIFRRPYTRVTLLLLISRVLLFPGFIWMALWKFHTSYSINNFVRKSRTSTNRYDSSMCTFDAGEIVQAFIDNCRTANNSRFESFMLLSMSYIVGEGLLFFGIDVVGRRLTVISSGMIGATSILAFVFANRQSAKVLLSVFFLAAYSILYTTTSIIIPENYPTAVRGTVVGLTSVLPHVAAFIVKYFARINCTRSLYVTSGLIIGATLTAVSIPDLTRAPMKE